MTLEDLYKGAVVAVKFLNNKLFMSYKVVFDRDSV